MKVVGLTGGIGSGKSTVANMFAALGVPIYVADFHAKRLMQSSPAIKRKLLREFGKKAYKNGLLNRAFLAEIVFNDASKLAAINAIVHPSVANSFKRWIKKQDSAYVIQENAILFESGSEKKFDHIILVSAPEEERVRRVMQRDQVSKKEVVARMNNQFTDEEKIPMSDFVIENDDLEKTKAQVRQIHRQILQKSRGLSASGDS